MHWIGMFVFSLWMLVLFSGPVNCWERNITSELNPGCLDLLCNGTYNVAYSRAEGPHDTLHYVWDLTNKPTLLLALTNDSSPINFDWNCTANGGNYCIHFSEDPIYKFGIVLNKVLEYNDENDTSTFNRNNKSISYVRVLHSDKFVWNRTVYEHRDSRSVTIGVKSKQYNDGSIVKNGSIQLMVKGFGYLDRSDELPHLLHTPNASQVDFVIDGLTPEPSFNNSRFAIELLVVGSDQSTTDPKLDIQHLKSLDDEHSPGVFKLLNAETPNSVEAAQGGYLQWRPIAYISPVRTISNSTETSDPELDNISNPAERLNGTIILSAFCSNSSVTSIPFAKIAIISFGVKEDGFYKKTKYTAWTFTVGYGKPPDEDFSPLVILIISIGLGIPAALVVVSGVVMLGRRLSRKKDDLFLGQ